MHPPKHILAKLQELHPWVRLGWVGEQAGGVDKSDDTDNRGCFALLQLYHKRDADRTYLSFWDSKGPVYGNYFDPIARTPIWLKNYSKQEVFSGEIIGDVIAMMRPLKERYETSARVKGSAVSTQMRDLSGTAGEYLWYRKNKKDNANNVAAKFEKPAEITRSSDGLKDMFMPNPPPGAVPIS